MGPVVYQEMRSHVQPSHQRGKNNIPMLSFKNRNIFVLNEENKGRLLQIKKIKIKIYLIGS